MARSLKKGPYIDPKLAKKIAAMERSGSKRVVRTWSRRSMITPELVGHTLAIYNGEKILPRVHNREHGRSQTRRIFADAHLPFPLRWCCE